MENRDDDYEVIPMFCQRCGKEVLVSDFRSESSLREFMVLGGCQECQDEVRLMYLKLKGRLK